MRSSTLCMVCCAFILGAVFTPARSQDQSQSFPYKPSYSSSFEIGDPAHARMVLQLWKDYDENSFDRHADWFADTAVIYLANGDVVKGRDNMLNGVKEYRNAIASVKTTIHAWMSLRSTDRKENWVALWATEEDTSKDGKTSAVSLHEVWRINKAGKIDQILQYAQKIPPEPRE